MNAKNEQLITMNHFSILCTLLQHAQRKFSATSIRKLTKLSERKFQRAKGQFKLPTPQIIAKSKSRPVRLIIDYVLISRNSKTLTYPFSLIFNQNNNQFGPTLSMLFAIAEIDGQYYPVAFDFWTQQEWDPVNFFSKNELAKYMITSLYEQGLVIEELLFDAGFCSAEFLNELNELQIPYVCRMKSAWKIDSYGLKRNARQMFGLSRRFYFDRHKSCYVFSRTGQFGDHKVKLVAIANSRQRLEEKKFYCLITNQVKLKHTQIFRHYLKRGKIEWFFKMMKSYLGLEAFFRHDPDVALIPHIMMRCAGFVLVQALAKSWKRSIESTLHELKQRSISEAQECLKEIFDQWAESLIESTKAESVTNQTQTLTLSEIT